MQFQQEPAGGNRWHRIASCCSVFLHEVWSLEIFVWNTQIRLNMNWKSESVSAVKAVQQHASKTITETTHTPPHLVFLLISTLVGLYKCLVSSSQKVCSYSNTSCHSYSVAPWETHLHPCELPHPSKKKFSDCVIQVFSLIKLLNSEGRKPSSHRVCEKQPKLNNHSSLTSYGNVQQSHQRYLCLPLGPFPVGVSAEFLVQTSRTPPESPVRMSPVLRKARHWMNFGFSYFWNRTGNRIRHRPGSQGRSADERPALKSKFVWARARIEKHTRPQRHH